MKAVLHRAGRASVLLGLLSIFGAFYSPGNLHKPVAPVPQLRAVLIVGHVEDATASFIKSMEEIRHFLESKGVHVSVFYDKKADWERIKTAARGAHFFIYSGHGSTLGENGRTGGLCLTQRISSKTLVEDLKLAGNALVIFKSVCRGAGSSAGDDGDIGIAEARLRVQDYAAPFFKTGAGAYYANNLGVGTLNFLKNFFDGKSLKECFELSAQEWAEVECIEPFAPDNSKQLGIASTNWGGTSTRTTYINGKKIVEKVPSAKEYEIAFVGNPGFAIAHMRK
ncbi:MAG: hypothetical protein KF690_03815 [Bacteroidetes bacterium]|nr:hypothetical protein [Bacteroidota bacterium]